MTDKILILDIDETLIHSERYDYEIIDFDFEIDLGESSKYFTYKRPFLDQFFAYIFENFQVGIFSTASYDYIIEILKNCNIDPNTFNFIWDREYCNTKFNTTTYERDYVKNLSKISKSFGLLIDKMIIIDDKRETALNNYGNLINIKPFMFDKNDTELLKLISYLEKIKNIENVRNIEKRGWSDN